MVIPPQTSPCRFLGSRSIPDDGKSEEHCHICCWLRDGISGIAKPNVIFGEPVDRELVISSRCRYYSFAMRYEGSEEFGSERFIWFRAHKNNKGVIWPRLHNI
jgi:hypothetical protein